MNTEIQDILKELQENIIELTWKRISDINNATNQNIDEYLIIFISNVKYYVYNFDFYVWFHRKYKSNKKIFSKYFYRYGKRQKSC